MDTKATFFCIPVTLTEATGCRFPVGDERPFLFCNNKINEDMKTSFCLHHCKIAYTPRQTKVTTKGNTGRPW